MRCFVLASANVCLRDQHNVFYLSHSWKLYPMYLFSFFFLSLGFITHTSEGSNLTPAHHYPDFRFKTYAPLAFRYFRDLFGIKPDDYLVRVKPRASSHSWTTPRLTNLQNVMQLWLWVGSLEAQSNQAPTQS